MRTGVRAAAGTVAGSVVLLCVATAPSQAIQEPAIQEPAIHEQAIQEPATPAPVVDRAESYRQALAAYFAGDDDTATDRFTELAAERGPGEQLARDYLAEPPRPRGDDEPWDPVPAGTAVLGAGALVGAGLILRRRRATQPLAEARKGTVRAVVPAQRRPGAEDPQHPGRHLLPPVKARRPR